MKEYMQENLTKQGREKMEIKKQEEQIKQMLQSKLVAKKLQKNSNNLIESISSVKSRSENIKSETYYRSSTSGHEDDISSYQDSDENKDCCKKDDVYMHDHPIDSDDEIEAKYIQDFGMPKYIGDMEQSRDYLRKRDLIEQIFEATLLEIEIRKINVRKELQMQKSFDLVKSLNKDII